MIRKALIIANPGEQGKEGYCAGVLRDIDNYTKFLTSPIGGFWRSDEIRILREPSSAGVKDEVRSIALADYSLTVFCGHGYHSSTTNSTVVVLRPGVDLDSAELRRGANKHSLILDCCRRVETPTIELREELLAKAAKAESEIHPSECRRLYDKSIEECPPGMVVLFACSVGERAGDDGTRGGYYSYSLISAAEAWSRHTYVDTSVKYSRLSVVATHDGAVPQVVRMSGGRQTPTIEKPRSGSYFPFCIIA